MTAVTPPTTGKRVRGALAAAGLYQRDAAAALDISQGQVSKRLADKIAFRPGEVEKLAELCGVPLHSLTGKRRRTPRKQEAAA